MDLLKYAKNALPYTFCFKLFEQAYLHEKVINLSFKFVLIKLTSLVKGLLTNPIVLADHYTMYSATKGTIPPSSLSAESKLSCMCHPAEEQQLGNTKNHKPGSKTWDVKLRV